MFKKAVKHEAKLRLAVTGTSGSGKTYTALAVATSIADGKAIAVVDTENGSAAKYADRFEFDVVEMRPPYHPDYFVQMIKEAERAGYAVIILDSLTHAWKGTGGILDLVEEKAKAMRAPNSFAAWKDVTPIQNRLIEAIVGSSIHIIATMRSKTEYIQSTNQSTGKQEIKKAGLAPEQRDGFEYEFDIVLDMNADNEGIVSKTRCPDITGKVFKHPGKQFAEIIKNWLHGVPVETPAKSQPEPERRQAPPKTPAANVINGLTVETKQLPPSPPPQNSGKVSDPHTRLFGEGVSTFSPKIWDEVRPVIVHHITKGLYTSESDLTDEERVMLTENFQNHRRQWQDWSKKKDDMPEVAVREYVANNPFA